MRIFGLFILIAANGWLTWFLDTQLLLEFFTVTGEVPLWAKYGLVGTVFSVINATIRPIIFFVSIPIKWLTLGLASFVLNAGLLWLAQESLNFLAIADISLIIGGIWVYFVVGLVLAAANSVLHWLV